MIDILPLRAICARVPGTVLPNTPLALPGNGMPLHRVGDMFVEVWKETKSMFAR
jgi:hypothetical protein